MRSSEHPASVFLFSHMWLRVNSWSTMAARAPAPTSTFQAMERKRQGDRREVPPPFDGDFPEFPKPISTDISWQRITWGRGESRGWKRPSFNWVPCRPELNQTLSLRRKGGWMSGWVPAVSRRHLLPCRKECLSRWSSVCLSICIANLGRESTVGR